MAGYVRGGWVGRGRKFYSVVVRVVTVAKETIGCLIQLDCPGLGFLS